MAENPISNLFNNRPPRPPMGAGPARAGHSARLIILMGLIVLAVITLSDCFYIIPPTEMAGVTRLGVVAVREPVGPGAHFKLPFIETVNPIQTSISRFNLPQVQVYTADNQLLDLGVSLTYQVPRSAVLHLLYDVGKAGDIDIDETIEPIIADRALRVFAQHKTINISERRAQIDEQMNVAISKALERLFGIHVIDIQIRSIRYTKAFDRAVEEAVEAKAQAVKEQNLVLEKRYMADQVVATAEGAAQARIAQAKGEAQATVLQATAQAQSIGIVAKARAQSIAEIGAAARENPTIIPYTFARRWNGTMPSTVVGDGKGADMFRMIVPSGAAAAGK